MPYARRTGPGRRRRSRDAPDHPAARRHRKPRDTTANAHLLGGVTPEARDRWDAGSWTLSVWLHEVSAGRLRTLGDCLDSFEGAEHVALVATLSQEPAERAPNLGEEVVAEVE